MFDLVPLRNIRQEAPKNQTDILKLDFQNRATCTKTIYKKLDNHSEEENQENKSIFVFWVKLAL